MTKSYTLPTHLDTATAPKIATDLLAVRGAALDLDAGAVAYVGALGLQVIVAARKQWLEDQHDFTISAASDGFLTGCAGLGVTLDQIGGSPQQELSA